MTLVIIFSALMLPGLALLLFVVAQFLWRGDSEVDASRRDERDDTP